MFDRPVKKLQSISSTDAKRLRILIVDDDMLTSNRLASILKTVEVETIEEVRDGNKATDAYQRRRHSIVFLDIDMPDRDGLSTLAELKTINPAVFVVMLSAHSSMSNVKKALALGANGFIVKPFTIGKIIEMLRNYVKTHTTNKAIANN